MNRNLSKIAICVLIATFIIALGTARADAPVMNAAAQSVTTAPLHDFGTTRPPRHGTSTLYRNDDGIAVTVDTKHLRGNAAHTFWIVIFNNNAACATIPCGLADLGNPAVQASVIFGGAAITTPNGKFRVSSGLDKGVPPAAPLRAGFGPGVLDPHGAEIHIIVQDHLGPVDLAEIHAMLQRPGAGPAGVRDVQSSIHLP